jgi:hypothetical protein
MNKRLQIICSNSEYETLHYKILSHNYKYYNHGLHCWVPELIIKYQKDQYFVTWYELRKATLFSLCCFVCVRYSVLAIVEQDRFKHSE